MQFDFETATDEEFAEWAAANDTLDCGEVDAWFLSDIDVDDATRAALDEMFKRINDN